jgi:hypothetical protein
MFTPKKYQADALASLDSFFRQLRTQGMQEAWKACSPLTESPDGSWCGCWTELDTVPVDAGHSRWSD